MLRTVDMLSIQDELDIACQISEGLECERLDMLAKCYAAYKRQQCKIGVLKEYQKVLERQLKRWTRGKCQGLRK